MLIQEISSSSRAAKGTRIVNTPFVLRIANRANQILPVHWHPEDENITVVQGIWCSGDKFNPGCPA
jgi:hypothetical protein